MGKVRLVVCAASAAASMLVPSAGLADTMTQKYLFTVTDRFSYATGDTDPYGGQFELTLTFNAAVTGQWSFAGPTSASEYRSFGAVTFGPTLFDLGLPVIDVPGAASTYGYAYESRHADATGSLQQGVASGGYTYSVDTTAGFRVYTLGLTLQRERTDVFDDLSLGTPTAASLLALLRSGDAPFGGHSFWLSSFAIDYVDGAGGQGGYTTDSYQYLGTFEAVPEPATLLLVGTGLLGAGALARRRRRQRP